MKFSNLKIASRLCICYGAILLMLILCIALALTKFSRLDDRVNSLTNDRIPTLNIANAWIIQVMETERHTRNMLILSDHDLIKKEFEAIDEEKKLRKQFRESLEQAIKLPEARTLFNEIVEARGKYALVEDEYLKLITAGDTDKAKDFLLQKMRPEQSAYVAALEKFIEFQTDVAKQGGIEAGNEYSAGRMTLIVLGAIAAILSALIAMLITRSLLKQLGGEPSDATHIAMQVANGDLTAQVNVAGNDQTSMMFAIKQMRDSLVAIVTDVRGGTETIALASNEISTGNLDLSSRTEQQAAALEETASSMEQLTATVKQNADNSRQASKLATSASEVAIKGGAVVAEVVSTMEAINESSRKIVDIIGVIDGIAFQTNILALNAAVEAARAGEQGRGFAVVASEVRNLAQRSAAAAKEIKGLISDSVEKVDTGSKLVNQAGATMEEVVASVHRVNDIISEITEASSEQAAGIDQINQAISQMDEVTQQNAALVEEAAAAAGSMEEQAAHLVDVVRVFKITADSQPHRSAARAPVVAKLKSAPVVAIGSATRQKPRAGVARNSAPKRASNSGESWEEF